VRFGYDERCDKMLGVYNIKTEACLHYIYACLCVYMYVCVYIYVYRHSATLDYFLPFSDIMTFPEYEGP
jgi:hypothetical protein